MHNEPVVIASIARTALASFQGEFSKVTSVELGAFAIKGAVSRAHLAPNDIDEVIMGCVLPAGLGQAPARQAALNAGIPNSTPCSTINKVCGSGMKAIMLAQHLIASGENKIMVAGGMESMTRAPYLLPDARQGMRLGHKKVLDHMYLDGLEDAYDKQLMGVYAEATAERYHFTREMQDEFAMRSLARAQEAAQLGIFNNEIVPVTVKDKIEKIVDMDEGPAKLNINKIPQLNPVFKKDGTVTAANSSSISDGAAAIVLISESQAQKRGIKPLAKIIGSAQFSHEPAWFTTAPVGAIKKLLTQINWSIDSVDLFEINEAFAVVAMAAIQDLHLPVDKVNVHGGACALGHPIGASGARIVVTLINALKHYKLKRGIAALCIGGGEATAIAVEL
ncbi:MAG: acetyl-CoA C-acyltransferase [Gammaproteobacteria bacterium]